MPDTPSIPQTATPPRITAFVAVTLIALAARLAYVLLIAGPALPADLPYDDEHWYWKLAESLHDGHGLVGEFGHRAERMPLYPAFLAIFAGQDTGIRDVRIAQCFLGALAAGLTYLLAHRIAGCTAGWLAGLIVALDPALVGSASLLLSETLFVTALTALWLAAWPLEGGTVWRWVAVAALAIVCIYLREASLAFVIILLAYIIIVRRDRRALAGCVSVALAIVLSLVPWAIRNREMIGQWRWLTTRGGISLYDGVRPGATGAGDLASVKSAPQVAHLSEAAWDNWFREHAWQAIRNDPLRVLGLVPSKLARTWSPIPHAFESRAIRLVFAVWYIPFYVFAFLGGWAMRKRPVALLYLLLPAIAVTLLHSVYVGSLRYRLGALPTLAILAAVGLLFVFTRRRVATAPES